jgi:pimeloyl-ACP methyl ester carboxylesterase
MATRMKPIYNHISYSTGDISYKQIQNSKPKLLMIHGFNDTKETFSFLEEYLSNYFHCISFDLRGHGDSAWNQGHYHSADYLIDIHIVTEELCSEPFYILGHSMGAGLGTRYAGLFPEKIKGLICLEGFSGLQSAEKEIENIKKWLSTMVRIKDKKEVLQKTMTFDELIHKVKYSYPPMPEDKLFHLALSLSNINSDGKYSWKNDSKIKNTSPIPFPPNLSRELWKRIQCPVLMIYGSKTHLMPNNMDEIKSHFQNLSYFVIENSGHNMHMDNPLKTIELIENFLRSQFDFNL